MQKCNWKLKVKVLTHAIMYWEIAFHVITTQFPLLHSEPRNPRSQTHEPKRTLRNKILRYPKSTYHEVLDPMFDVIWTLQPCILKLFIGKPLKSSIIWRKFSVEIFGASPPVQTGPQGSLLRGGMKNVVSKFLKFAVRWIERASQLLPFAKAQSR